MMCKTILMLRSADRTDGEGCDSPPCPDIPGPADIQASS